MQTYLLCKLENTLYIQLPMQYANLKKGFSYQEVAYLDLEPSALEKFVQSQDTLKECHNCDKKIQDKCIL